MGIMEKREEEKKKREENWNEKSHRSQTNNLLHQRYQITCERTFAWCAACSKHSHPIAAFLSSRLLLHSPFLASRLRPLSLLLSLLLHLSQGRLLPQPCVQKVEEWAVLEAVAEVLLLRLLVLALQAAVVLEEGGWGEGLRQSLVAEEVAPPPPTQTSPAPPASASTAWPGRAAAASAASAAVREALQTHKQTSSSAATALQGGMDRVEEDGWGEGRGAEEEEGEEGG